MGAVRNILLGSRRRRAATLLVIMLTMTLVMIELSCQVLGFFVIRRLDAAKLEPNHYYQVSDDPVLACELRHSFSCEMNGRSLRINKFGFREDSDSTFEDKRRVAIFGDSCSFGTGVSQDETVPAELQKRVDPAVDRIKVLNCARPGLGLEAYVNFWRKVEAAYKPHAVIYVLNPNDFVTRETVYEGADNGLYRQYAHPTFKAPWMFRKAVYRMVKGGVNPTTRWYKWLYEGTKAENLPNLLALRDAVKKSGASFTLVLLPVRASFSNEDKTIQEIYGDLQAFAKQNGIECFDPAPTFAKHGGIDDLIDVTDHFVPAGCKVMAEALADLVKSKAGE